MESDRNSAFTLVEIIIVLSILAILTTTSVVGYGFFMQNTRDSRRQADLQSIQTAIQEYRKFEGHYPANLDDLITSSPSYMEELPQDPKEGQGDFGYQYSQNDNTFILTALLENGEYFQINPYGAEFVASNPMETTPSPSAAFATNPPTIAPSSPTYTKTYKYYASLYMKSHPYGDLYHYQYTNIVLNNVTNSEANVKIYIKDFLDGSNLLNNNELYIERTIQPKGLYNSSDEIAEFYGKTDNNITTPDPRNLIPPPPDHQSALGWIEIESDKPLAGYNRLLLLDGTDITDTQIDFDDEAIHIHGNKRTYYPLYSYNTTTEDGQYKQFTDLYIVNPDKTQGTNVTINIRADDGSMLGSDTVSISAHSSWSSQNKASWKNIISPLTSGVGSIELLSDTTEVYVSVRSRITDQSDNAYPATNPNSSDAYYARSIILEDEPAAPAEKASTELVYPLYQKKYKTDNVSNRWQWSNIELLNIDNSDATATIKIYTNESDSTPYHSIPLNIPALGRWSSYGNPLWQIDDSTYPVPTNPPSNPNGIPRMTNLGENWGDGWMKIESNTRILALNRTTTLTEVTNPPTDSDPIEMVDDELFIPLNDTSTKLYQTHYLRNWIGGPATTGQIIRQFTSPLLINPNSEPTNVTFIQWAVDDGSEIRSFSITINPYSRWNASEDPDWFNSNSFIPDPDPSQDETNAWTEISSTKPIFGMNRMRFQIGNNPSMSDPNTEVYLLDDDINTLYYADDIYACVEDADCNAGETCSNGECQ